MTGATGRGEDLPPGVGAQVAGCACRSARVIAPRAMWSEARLQRRRTYQAIVARGIRRVITTSAISPQTGRCHVGTNQSVMTRGIAGIIAACPMSPAAERSAKGALLTGTRGGIHGQQEQEEGEDVHEVVFPWYHG